PLFQMTYRAIGQKCPESNHIDIACLDGSRYWSTIETVFNFSIVSDIGNGDLPYIAFFLSEVEIFSNFFIYLEYDGYQLLYCVFEKRMNRSDVGVWINVFDK